MTAVNAALQETRDWRKQQAVFLDPKLLLITAIAQFEKLKRTVPDSKFILVAAQICRILDQLAKVTKEHQRPFSGRRLLRPLLVVAILGGVALLCFAVIRANLELRLPNWWDTAQGFGALTDLILLIGLTLWSDLGGGLKKMVGRHLSYLALLRNSIALIKQFQADKDIPWSMTRQEADSLVDLLAAGGEHIKSLDDLRTYFECAQDLLGLIASAIAFYISDVTEKVVLDRAHELQQLIIGYSNLIGGKLLSLNMLMNRPQA